MKIINFIFLQDLKRIFLLYLDFNNLNIHIKIFKIMNSIIKFYFWFRSTSYTYMLEKLFIKYIYKMFVLFNLQWNPFFKKKKFYKNYL